MVYHWGSFIVPPGYTDDAIFEAGGNPYGTSATANANGTISDAVRRAAEHQARRVVQVAQWLKIGQQATAESFANVSVANRRN
jgi:NAD(P)H dehydrogenase (quinone)